MTTPLRLKMLQANPGRAPVVASLLGRATAAAGLALVAATWALWTPQTSFPRVSLVSAFRFTPAGLEWAAFGVAILALVLLLCAGTQRSLGRWAGLAFAASLTLLVLTDQHRLQPWAYEFAILALILAAAPAAEAIPLGRLLIISVYFYSALSKADRTFLEAGGGQIVDGLLAFFRVGGDGFLLRHRRLLAGLLPAAEFLIAAGLYFRRTRMSALAGSIVMHLLLLAALGPWGAGHQPGVLLWNLFFIVQNVLLFGAAGEAESASVTVSDFRAGSRIPGFRLRLRTTGIRALVGLAVLFPATEPFGICDVWPAWAVYAAGPERLRVYIRESDRSRLPPAVRRFIESPRFSDDRCLVRIDRWSLEALRAPVYPQNRFRLGVALALAESGGLSDILVEIDGQADRWSGTRSSQTLKESAAIRAALARCWLNGLPRPFVGGSQASAP